MEDGVFFLFNYRTICRVNKSPFQKNQVCISEFHPLKKTHPKVELSGLLDAEASADILHP